MTEIRLKYGRSELTFDVPERNLIEVLEPRITKGVRDEDMEIERALHEPVDAKPISKLLKPGCRVTIVASDITRTCPNHKLLPPILRELRRGGLRREDITILFGVGIHRRHTAPEWSMLIGEDAVKGYRVIDSVSNEGEMFTEVGRIPLGSKLKVTPVMINRIAVEADLTICMAEVAFHQMAGYSGGYKSILPGVASKETVQIHHSLLTHPMSVTGRIEGNPFRGQIEEACKPMDNVQVVNVVQNSNKEIVRVEAGDPISVHRDLTKWCDKSFRVSAKRKADIVVASPGGHPKDINLYQSQKAVERARFIVRDGGVIILVAEAAEGFGDEVFREWMFQAESPASIYERLEREGFKIGGHKALLFARAMKKASIILVSNMKNEDVERSLMIPKRDVKNALEEAFKMLGGDSQVTVLTTAHIFPGFPEG